jgi:hypothetical protein
MSMKTTLNIKDALRFCLLVVLVTIAFTVVSASIPYSEGLRSLNGNADPSVMLYVLVTVIWFSLTTCYIIKQSSWSNRKLILALTMSLFAVTSFMTQIETWFFGSAFTVLTGSDIFWIAIANGTLIFAGVPLAVVLFRKRNPAVVSPAPQLHLTAVAGKLLIVGLCYVLIYFSFGYFVAWQEPDLRLFYSGHTDDRGFFTGLADNFRDRPVIFPFQFMRGILFGIFVLPIVNMFSTQPLRLFISLALIFSCTGIALIIPNVLFPDTVRWAHFREMMSSMFVFSLVVWWLYHKPGW